MGDYILNSIHGNIKHGLRTHPLYHVWRDMKGRCQCETHVNYHNYGGRGIKICEEWQKDFKSFYEWSMNNGYKKGLTLDRSDNNGNYNPENCRFVDWFVQNNNRRRDKGISIFCRKYGLEQHYNNISYHIRKGQSFEWVLKKYENKLTK